MSTYAIASAIEKFSKDFTKALDEKNKIEREKLKFEKAKLELEFNNEQLSNESNCEHEWYQYIIDFDKERKYIAHICSRCGKATIKSLN